MAVGRRLREARLRAGLSQRDLAFAGCTAAYISRIESGERTPSLQLLRELGRRLGVSAAYLAVAGSDESADDDPVAQAELSLRLDDSEAAEQQLAETAANADDPRTRARASAALGQVAFARGAHEAAIERFETVLAEWPPLLEEDAAIADSLGRAYAHTSRYEQAIALFERCLGAAEEHGDLMATIRFAVLLANTLADRGRFGRAEELLGHALALSERSKDPFLRARLWWSQSRLHALQHDSERAERYARLALDTLLLTEHVRYSALAHQVLAHIRLDQGEASLHQRRHAFRQCWHMIPNIQTHRRSKIQVLSCCRPGPRSTSTARRRRPPSSSSYLKEIFNSPSEVGTWKLATSASRSHRRPDPSCRVLNSNS